MKAEDIQVVNEAVGKAIQGYLESDGTFDLDIAELKLKIYLKGPKWTGRVDKPVAKFLLDLDARLNEELKKLEIDIPESEHGLVALRIEKGSLQAFLEYAPQVYDHLKMLDGGQKVVVLATILTSFGLLKSVREKFRHGEIDEEVGESEVAGTEKLKAEARDMLLAKMESIDNSAAKLQKPLKDLIKTMAPEDEITLPADGKPMKKEIASESLDKARRSRSNSRTYFIDHPYIVENLETKKTGSWNVSLRFGDLTFKAKLMLQPEQIDRLLGEYREAHAQGRKIAPHLHVTAEINSRGIKTSSAAVVGMGDARQGSVKITKALADQKKS